MLRFDLTPSPASEKKQLGLLAAAFSAMGLFWLAMGAGPRPLGVFAVLAAAAFAGYVFPAPRRDIYVVFAVTSWAIGRAVSWAAVALIYVFGIAFCGSILRLFRMDRLRGDFAKARKQASFFSEVEPVDKESFRRQS